MYIKAPTHADCAEKISCILRHLPMLMPRSVYIKAPTHADCAEKISCILRHLPMLTVPRRFRAPMLTCREEAPTHADCREDFVYIKAPTHADCAEKISCILRHLPMLTVPRRFRVF